MGSIRSRPDRHSLKHKYELGRRKDVVCKRPCAVGKVALFDLHRVQDTQEQVAHAILTLSPVGAVFETHVATTGDEGRKILGPVRGACSAPVKDDRIVQHTPLSVLILIKPPKKIGQLFT